MLKLRRIAPELVWARAKDPIAKCCCWGKTFEPKAQILLTFLQTPTPCPLHHFWLRGFLHCAFGSWPSGTFRNLPEPSGTCACDPHRRTPELIWAEDPISLRCWGKIAFQVFEVGCIFWWPMLLFSMVRMKRRCCGAKNSPHLLLSSPQRPFVQFDMFCFFES